MSHFLDITSPTVLADNHRPSLLCGAAT